MGRDGRGVDLDTLPESMVTLYAKFKNEREGESRTHSVTERPPRA